MGDVASAAPGGLRYRVSEPRPCGVYTAGVTGAFVLSRAEERLVPTVSNVEAISELEAKGHPGFAGSAGVAVSDITPDLDVRARCWGRPVMTSRAVSTVL